MKLAWVSTDEDERKQYEKNKNVKEKIYPVDCGNCVDCRLARSIATMD